MMGIGLETAPATATDEIRPAFDYSGLDAQTVDTLHMAENQYTQGKKMAETGLRWMVNAVSMAHDALCSPVVQQLDNGGSGACATVAQAHNNQHSENNFRAWCETIGISRSSAYNLLRVAERFGNIELDGKSILDVQPATLLYEAAKPSAPEEMVQKVTTGEITSSAEYRAILKENQQLRTERVEAMNRADRAESRAQTAETQRDAALADVQGLTEQNVQLQQSYHDADESRIAANLQRQKAEAERDRAEERAKNAEDALKKQPIAGVVDEEEIDRRAHQQAYSIAADMTEELKADKAKLQTSMDELKQQLAEAQAVVPADLLADKETADSCYLNIDGIWGMALPSFQRLVGTGEDFNGAAGKLMQLCENIKDQLVKMTIANDKETLYD